MGYIWQSPLRQGKDFLVGMIEPQIFILHDILFLKSVSREGRLMNSVVWLCVPSNGDALRSIGLLLKDEVESLMLCGVMDDGCVKKAQFFMFRLRYEIIGLY